MSENPRRNVYRKPSADLFEPKTSLKKVQLEIKINISFKLIEVIPTYPCSKSITFRLNPLPTSTTSKEIDNKNVSSEIYTNPKLIEKIKQFQPKLHVDLSKSNLIDEDMIIITEQVLNEKKCTELWLYENNLTSKGISILAANLKTNSILKSLDLSFNKISDSGVRLLSEGISSNSNNSLQILYLSKNMISDIGIKYLSDMLQTNKILTELWLSDNEISDKGVEQLVNVLIHQSKTLKLLSFSMNKLITDLSIAYLIELFEHNKILKTIWMKDCNLTEQGKVKLKEKIDRKKKIKIDL